MKSNYIEYKTIYKVKGYTSKKIFLMVVNEYRFTTIYIIQSESNTPSSDDINNYLLRYDFSRGERFTAFDLTEDELKEYLGIAKDFVKSFKLDEPFIEYEKEYKYKDEITDEEIIENTENAVESRLRKPLKD